jgi:hypothetical protein
MENYKTIQNQNLWRKIPYDVFINNIIPYTYQKIDSNLLNDIQNFIHDYMIILNYYSFEMNEFFLIHDILVFLISDEITIDFLNRNVMFKNLSLDKKYDYIQHFQKILNSKVEQKNKFLLALMTPSERALFINKHIIAEIEDS